MEKPDKDLESMDCSDVSGIPYEHITDTHNNDTSVQGTSKEIDLSKYFSSEVLNKMSQLEKNVYINKVKNYWMLNELGMHSISRQLQFT